MFAYLRGVWKGIAPALLLAVGIGAVVRTMLPDAGWLALAGKVCLYSVVYLVAMWSIGMRSDERSAVRAALRRKVPG